MRARLLVVAGIALAACTTPAVRAGTMPGAAPVAATGVTVYVFDGGIGDSVAGTVRRGFTAYPGDAPVCNGHGAAVASALLGATASASPELELVDVKVIDCWRQRGSGDAVLHAARWAIDDARRHPGRRAVANWSFTASTVQDDPSLAEAVESLVRAGIPVVISAGNQAVDACRIAPANIAAAITVGSRTGVTAHGRCVDVYASGSAHGWSGTSIAAAQVSAVVARYLARHPGAGVAEVAGFVGATSARVASR